MKKFYQQIPSSLWFRLLLAFFLAFLVILPYANQGGIYNQDDLAFHKLRLEAYYQSVSQGNFFPKIFPEMANQYGYAADLFYPSIFLLPYALLRLGGLSFVTAYLGYQWLLTVLTFLLAYWCYFQLKKDRQASYLFATIYTTATYRLLDQFIRGALGETISLLFLPLVALALYQLFIQQKNSWHLLALGMTGLLYCHMITAYTMAWLILFLCIFFILTKRFTMTLCKHLFLATITTCFLSLWILVPILEQVAAISFNFSNQPRLWQIGLNYSPWDFFSNALANASGNWQDLKPGIGIFLLVILVVAWYLYPKASHLQRKLTWWGTFFCLLPTNLFPWTFFQTGPWAFIQFPWRLLALTTLILSLLAVSVLKQLQPLTPSYTSLIIAGLVLLTFSFNGNALNHFQAKGVNLITNQNHQTFQPNALGGGKEYLVAGTDYDAIQADQSHLLKSNQPMTTSNYFRNDQKIVADVHLITETEIYFPKVPYVGYQLLANGQGVALEINHHQLTTTLAPGDYHLELSYPGTFLQHVSLWLSGISALGFLAYLQIRKTSKTPPT